jgi:hypothetical protein
MRLATRSRKRGRRGSHARRARRSAALHVATPNDVHTALWRCFAKSTGPTGSPTPALTDAPVLRAAAPLDILARHLARVPKALLGLAVWQQVPTGGCNSGAPSAALTSLLHTLLDLDFPTAVYLRSKSPDRPFPPYPDRIILDCRYTHRMRKGEAEATLEICVPAELGALKAIVHPSCWGAGSAARFFWSAVHAPPSPSRANSRTPAWPIRARLSLPGVNACRPVQLRAAFSDDAFHARIAFEMRPNPLIVACRGDIRVEKECGHPGAVRVINRKAVRFAPGPLHDQAVETLEYWVQAETTLLVLQSHDRREGGWR